MSWIARSIAEPGRRRVPWRARDIAATALLLASVHACSAAGEPPAERPAGPDEIVVGGVGLDRPASILHDPIDDVYLVGNAPERGSAFIARLSPAGRVRDLRWVDGAAPGVQLRSPGGMAIRGDTLYVADGECVRLFRRASGLPVGSVCPPGAVSLNDAAAGSRAGVYASDAGGGAVYVIDGTTATEVARDHALAQSGGLAAGERGVFVAGAGLHQLTPDGPRVVIRDSGKRLGGIVFTRGGSFAFGNHGDSTVLFVEARESGTVGAVWTLARDLPSPGYLGYDARRERILVPQADHDRLVFISLRR